MPSSPKTRGIHTLSVPQTPAGTSYTAATANSTAHTNPEKLDLIQVLSQGMKVIWNLDYQGNSHFNPTNPTKKAGLPVALFLQTFAASFAIAFPNPEQNDVYQVHDGSKVVHHIDYLGNSFTP